MEDSSIHFFFSGFTEIMKKIRMLVLLCVALSGAGIHRNGSAQTAEFYSKANITLTIGVAVGGSYDLIGRLVGRHMGRHILGNPNIVPQNMPGAGGLIAANYLYNIAAKDGSVLGVIIPSVIFNQIFKEANVQFDASKFQWIGNPLEAGSVTTMFYTAPVKSWQDAKIHTALIGATGSDGPDAMVARLANATLNTKFQIVSGYKGGQEIALAMERGEVHGRGTQSWAGWKATNPEWVADGKLIPLWQLAIKPLPELESVPLLIDLVSDEDDKALVKVYTDVNALGRPLAAGPDVPAPRIALLRKAFDDTMKDSAFIADAEKLQVELGPVSGEEIQKMVNNATSLDPKLISRLEGVIR